MLSAFLHKGGTERRGEKERTDVENDRVKRKGRADNFVDVDVEAKTGVDASKRAKQ